MRELANQTAESASKKRPRVRPWFVAAPVCCAVLLGWLVWPTGPEKDPYELSTTDGKPRFCTTTFPETPRPAKLTLPQRLAWEWTEYKQLHRVRNPTASSFPASPVGPCLIVGLLDQCMEVSGTQYLVAAEIEGGTVEFGNTNTLNGAQWVAAFENAIATSPVDCYDFAKKRDFQDTLLLIRDTPGKVKVVPRTKLADYQKAGLVKTQSR